jgi:hypothetical protein
MSASTKDVIEYLKKLAKDHCGETAGTIHFFRPHQSPKYWPYLSFDKTSFNLQGTVDSVTSRRSVTFSVFKHLNETDNDDKIDQLIDEVETIILNIIDTMKADYRARKSPIRALDINSIVCTPVSGNDQEYGWEVSLVLKN